MCNPKMWHYTFSVSPYNDMSSIVKYLFLVSMLMISSLGVGGTANIIIILCPNLDYIHKTI